MKRKRAEALGVLALIAGIVVMLTLAATLFRIDERIYGGLFLGFAFIFFMGFPGELYKTLADLLCDDD